MNDRRQIEDYLPLDVLNAIASKEKLHPRRYVELIHYWPARRPITACRAAIYSTLVSAPHNETTRNKAANFVAKLAAYSPDLETIAEAQEHIKKLHGGRAPKVLDLFAGGGAIPLEAARLGCESHAVEYNPVAHLIELCTLVYPQSYGPSLADDFQKWSETILDRIQIEIGDFYSSIDIKQSDSLSEQTNLFQESDSAKFKAEPVAFIWARTVPCRRPGCSAPVPLVRQSWLRKKNGAVAAVPRVEHDQLVWDIVVAHTASGIAKQTEQTRSGQAVCVACHTPIPAKHVKEMSVAGRMGESLAAVVAHTSKNSPGKRHQKLYLPPSSVVLQDDDEYRVMLDEVLSAANFAPLDETMETENSTTVAGQGYGISKWCELFTPRQLLVLFTLIKHIQLAHEEMLENGMSVDRAKALITYFAMAFDRVVIAFNKFTRWEPRVQRTMGALGDRPVLKMVYDFSEINPLAQTQGCLPLAFDREAFCIRELARVKHSCVVKRGNAEKLFYDDETFDAVITDPPYYSNIFYADLSAFFYVWLKRIVGHLYPEHFALPSPPKSREVVAQASEHGGDTNKAKDHYECLMRNALAEARRVLKRGAPMVCVYAHRTTEGWATLIRALVGAGMTVTEAWPINTESRGRVIAHNAAALSHSIFFVARRREGTETGQYETLVEPQLREIARERVKTMWNNGKGIGGADLLMAAVGAGLRAYTQFASVEYANGELVSAEQYLRDVEGVILDVMLDEIFDLRGAEVAGVDSVTRFYILWRFTYRGAKIEAGDAFVFCYPQGIEMDGPSGLAGEIPKLVEKSGNKFRVRNYAERGSDERLGLETDDKAAPLIDVLHRLLYLLETQPTIVPQYLERVRPNQEQLRLVAQALAVPSLGQSESLEASLASELNILTRLNANWRTIFTTYDAESLITGQKYMFSDEESK